MEEKVLKIKMGEFKQLTSSSKLYIKKRNNNTPVSPALAPILPLGNNTNPDQTHNPKKDYSTIEIGRIENNLAN